MLSQELEFCLNDAFAAAREARHEFMTVEHLLLAIVDTPKVREILKSCGAFEPGPNWTIGATSPRGKTVPSYG